MHHPTLGARPRPLVRLPPLVVLAGLVAVTSGLAAERPPARLALPDWSDGLAEVAGHRASVPKYGAMRDGEEFLITVEEEQDRRGLVKALREAPASSTRRVVKLNRELTVPTGIYTYRQMSSAFVDQSTLEVTKIVASSQEWCGTTFVHALARDGRLDVRTFSYFEGEGDRTFVFDWPAGAWAADALPILVRALPSDRRGAMRDISFLRSLLGNRVGTPSVVRADVTWSAPSRPDDARAATLPDLPVRAVQEVVVELETGERHVLVVQADGGRLLLAWSRPGGGSSTLVATDRVAYWRMNGPGEERRRAELAGRAARVTEERR